MFSLNGINSDWKAINNMKVSKYISNFIKETFISDKIV